MDDGIETSVRTFLPPWPVERLASFWFDCAPEGYRQLYLSPFFRLPQQNPFPLFPPPPPLDPFVDTRASIRGFANLHVLTKLGVSLALFFSRPSGKQRLCFEGGPALSTSTLPLVDPPIRATEEASGPPRHLGNFSSVLPGPRLHVGRSMSIPMRNSRWCALAFCFGPGWGI